MTSLLTIFVALFGFRMLLGHTPGVRDGVVAATKVGLVLVLASSWGANGSALVRFEVVRRDAGGRASTATPYVAVLRYRLLGEPMSVEDRFVNPLGFQVLRYRRDQEALPVVQPAVIAAPPPIGRAVRPPVPSATTGPADRVPPATRTP